MNTLDSDLVAGQQDPLDTKYADAHFPTLVTRIKALVIDGLIMLLVFSGTSVLINLLGHIPSFIKGFVLIFMFYLYDPVLTAFTGSTLGHKVMNLEVRQHNEPEKKISLGQAFVRFALKGLLGWISFLTVTGNKRKRAIHDFASGSIILVRK